MHATTHCDTHTRTHVVVYHCIMSWHNAELYLADQLVKHIHMQRLKQTHKSRCGRSIHQDLKSTNTYNTIRTSN